MVFGGCVESALHFLAKGTTRRSVGHFDALDRHIRLFVDLNKGQLCDRCVVCATIVDFFDQPPARSHVNEFANPGKATLASGSGGIVGQRMRAATAESIQFAAKRSTF